MKKRDNHVFLVLVWMAALLASALLFADEKRKSARQEIPQGTQTQKFSGIRLRGELKKPELTYTYQGRGVPMQSWVGVPDSLDKRIERSAEDL